MYANDASNYRQVPIGVVIPKTLDDIVATHRAARVRRADRQPGRRHQPVRGNGQLRRGHRQLQVPDPGRRHRRRHGDCHLRTGVINEQLNRKTGRHGMVFGPDPSSHSRCTIGGNSATTRAGSIPCRPSSTAPGRAPPTTPTRWRWSPTTASASGSGLARRISSRRSSPPGRAQGRDLRLSCATSATATPTHPRALPAVATCPPRLGLQPRRAAARARFQRRPCAGRHREHLRDRAPGQAQADAGAAQAHARGRRVRRDRRRRRALSWRSSAVEADRLEALDHG